MPNSRYVVAMLDSFNAARLCQVGAFCKQRNNESEVLRGTAEAVYPYCVEPRRPLCVQVIEVS